MRIVRGDADIWDATGRQSLIGERVLWVRHRYDTIVKAIASINRDWAVQLPLLLALPTLFTTLTWCAAALADHLVQPSLYFDGYAISPASWTGGTGTRLNTIRAVRLATVKKPTRRPRQVNFVQNRFDALLAG